MFHFDCGSQRVTVRTAVISDVDRLADLYRAVQITAKQCHEALNAADGSFQQRGGMFEISSAAAIEQLVRDPAETVLVGESGGSVCGLLWYGMAKADTFADLQPLPERQAEAEAMAHVRANGACGYAKEIISVGEDTPREMPFALFYAMMSDYVHNGVAQTVGEVYSIDRYETQGSIYVSGLINLASYRFLLKCGGIELGATGQKQVKLEQYAIWKTPHIFLWNTIDARNIIRQELTERGWRICEDECNE